MAPGCEQSKKVKAENNIIPCSTTDPWVAVAHTPAHYSLLKGADSILAALRECARQLGWCDDESGTFGRAIPKGSRVVVKPNWVLHANQGGGGLAPLITHQSFIQSVVSEALKAGPESVIVGDAPIQMCDWDQLMRLTGIERWAEELQRINRSFEGIRDFRRTTCKYMHGVRIASESIVDLSHYVLFNLGSDSLLEPITKPGLFRVTSYDPRLMAKTHSPGNHQYLIAKDVLEADVVINLPKLKTHKKAGISCALKNLVGINGNKEYLPHHRVGGAEDGGDCYPGRDRLKRGLEVVLDAKNRASSKTKAKLLAGVESQLSRALRFRGDRIGVEGSWSGNETVARMTLDLNRILLYGRADGSMADTIQRRVLNVVDGIVAGQGNGPLANDELPLGLVLAGHNAAAVDFIGASFLNFDPFKIPLLQLAFEDFRWRVANFATDEIEIKAGALSSKNPDDFINTICATKVAHPSGWENAARIL